jgi:hypothetical protein
MTKQMFVSKNVSKHFKEVFFGGNWTVSNVKDQVSDITWEQSVKKIDDLNTIAMLTYHIGYFVNVALKVLKGGPLEGDDKISYDHPPINSQADWDKLCNKVLADAEEFAALTAELPEKQLWEIFPGEKYGIWYRNLAGIIEHTHYHLGQIAILKKLTAGNPE